MCHSIPPTAFLVGRTPSISGGAQRRPLHAESGDTESGDTNLNSSGGPSIAADSTRGASILDVSCVPRERRGAPPVAREADDPRE